VNRGLTTKQERDAYLHPSFSCLPEPKFLKNAETAAELIAESIHRGKKFRIIGDYDVDGIMSVYILYRCMTTAGANVDYRIPDRIKDGYGLNEDMVQECIAAGVEVIVTCDNGIAAMESTLSNASSNLGGSISDASDADTEADMTGKIHNCTNHGAVVADLNGGGIAGAMSFENDLDPDANLQFSGQLSLNFDTTVRCVITSCTNSGTVSVKKATGGGIVGWQSMGLVKQCFNEGDLDAQSAEQVGGIAGSSGGYIRGCLVRCAIAGDTAVGGIAGVGAVVSDCYSLSVLHGSEQIGALLGQRQESYPQEESPVHTNYYFAPEKDPGGIDGVSYEGIAQAL
jgi:hypothetical protein